ncbi:MAG: hypothetical protein NWF05_03250 [Candidatus Bathyarchaeota archaeon]|nr:hypothetical protein [Candidatus Bathyarchaeota archaeon]
MVKYSKPERPIGIYFILVWMVLNTVLLALMIPGDPEDLNNYIEPVLWVASMVGLAAMKKAGAAWATTVLGITLGTSLYNMLISFYTGNLGEPVGYVNALRIAVNAIAIVYLYRCIFAGKFK